MKPKVVLCGSYHRCPDLLQRIFRELEATGCRILSPISLEFTEPAAAVVRTATEYDVGIAELERMRVVCSVFEALELISSGPAFFGGAGSLQP